MRKRRFRDFLGATYNEGIIYSPYVPTTKGVVVNGKEVKLTPSRINVIRVSKAFKTGLSDEKKT